MIYVYCRRASNGAAALAKELGAQRIRQFDGMNLIRKGKKLSLSDGDVVICWGDQLPEDVAKGKQVRFLNNIKPEMLKAASDKYAAAQLLLNAGVPTIDIYPRDYFGPVNTASIKQLKSEGYLPRAKDHVGGFDLLDPNTKPDYWVKKDEFVAEFRIHSFGGKGIRAGKKMLREGYSLDGANGTKKAHPWVRSYDGGWYCCYDGFKSVAAQRTIAHKAVEALGLTFGAVDIAQRKDGKYVVLEVNRAPGIEGNSIRTYTEVIKRWIDGDTGVRAEDGEPKGAVVDVPKKSVPPAPTKTTAKYVAAPSAAAPRVAAVCDTGQFIREYYTINIAA